MSYRGGAQFVVHVAVQNTSSRVTEMMRLCACETHVLLSVGAGGAGRAVPGVVCSCWSEMVRVKTAMMLAFNQMNSSPSCLTLGVMLHERWWGRNVAWVCVPLHHRSLDSNHRTTLHLHLVRTTGFCVCILCAFHTLFCEEFYHNS